MTFLTVLIGVVFYALLLMGLGYLTTIPEKRRLRARLKREAEFRTLTDDEKMKRGWHPWRKELP